MRVGEIVECASHGLDLVGRFAGLGPAVADVEAGRESAAAADERAALCVVPALQKHLALFDGHVSGGE